MIDTWDFSRTDAFMLGQLALFLENDDPGEGALVVTDEVTTYWRQRGWVAREPGQNWKGAGYLRLTKGGHINLEAAYAGVGIEVEEVDDER